MDVFMLFQYEFWILTDYKPILCYCVDIFFFPHPQDIIQRYCVSMQIFFFFPLNYVAYQLQLKLLGFVNTPFTQQLLIWI